MIKFKTLKYKHYQRAVELQNDDAPEAEHVAYVMSLVEEWDFTDIESGQPIPPGQPDELSLAQFKEVMGSFNGQFNRENQVKKANAGRSPSSSTHSKAAKPAA